jgi:molybdopterin synthase sulfur carrier subunit
MDTEWKLFANLAEAVDARSVDVSVDGGDATVRDALDALVTAHPALEPLVLEDGELQGHVNLLRNGEPASLDDDLAAGDELAIFPPVTGG